MAAEQGLALLEHHSGRDPSSLTWGPGLGQGGERPGSNSMAPLVPSDFQLIYPESPNLPETLGAKI